MKKLWISVISFTATLNMNAQTLNDTVPNNYHNYDDSLQMKKRQEGNQPSGIPKREGGALIDKINTKPNKNMDDQVDSTSKPRSQQSVKNDYPLMAFQDKSKVVEVQDDKKTELNNLITEAEKSIILIKSRLKQSKNSDKSMIASLENKKNELKSRIKMLDMSGENYIKWKEEYRELAEKISQYKESIK